MIQKIAVGLSTDIDLSNLSLAGAVFANVLNPDEADIWRKRFLARYDYPIGLDDPEDYAVAYKLRRFVLRRLDGEALRNADTEKSMHQLLVILDMVIGKLDSQLQRPDKLTYCRNIRPRQVFSTTL